MCHQLLCQVEREGRDYYEGRLDIWILFWLVLVENKHVRVREFKVGRNSI